MNRNVRTLVLALAGAMLLASCGVINSLIPDQTFDDGVLGIGASGVQVELSAAAPAGIQTAAPTTTFTGSLSGSATVDGSDAIPDFVDVDAIVEALELGATVEVTFPSAQVESFTVTSLTVAGTVSVDGGAAIPLPAGTGLTGIAVTYTVTGCVADTCTFTATAAAPTFDVSLPAQVVAAFGDLLRDGGTVSADLLVTMTVASPGIEEDATITVTLTSLGATVSF